MRLTTRELLAVTHAITDATAGKMANWTAAQQRTLNTAQQKINDRVVRRKDYARVAADWTNENWKRLTTT
jgi:hypothetical protein